MRWLGLVATVMLVACGDNRAQVGSDGGTRDDAPVADAPVFDAAPIDAPADAPADAPSDAPPDAPLDAGPTLRCPEDQLHFGSLEMQPALPAASDTIPLFADLDGDGRVDQIAWAISGITVSVASGNGQFGTPTSYGGHALGEPRVADVDGDGFADLVFLNLNVTALQVGVLRGRGDGTFDPLVVVDAGDSDHTGSFPILTTADVNGDGRADAIVVGRQFTACLTFLSQGGALYGPAVTSADPHGSELTFAAAFDITGDGVADLVTYNNGLALATFLGHPDGTFTALSTAPDLFGLRVTGVADLDGDGLADLVAIRERFSPPSTSVASLLSQGDGSFAVVELPLTDSFTHSSAQVSAVADFDGDGVDDFAFVGLHSTQILPGHGDGTFDPVAITSGPAVAPFFTAADIDDDGAIDLAYSVGHSNAGTTTWAYVHNDGAGVFPLWDQPLATTSPFTVVDLDGDGRLDLLVGSTALLQQSPRAFTSQSVPQLAAVAAVADFNGDGTPDVASQSGEVFFLPLGTLAPVQSPTTFGPVAAAGDFNGDGRVDLAIVDPSGPSVVSLFNDGSGTLIQTQPAAPAPGGNVNRVLFGHDLNGDGFDDVVLASIPNQNTPAPLTFDVYLANADGSFASPVHHDTAIGATRFAVVRLADIDLDGHLDVAVLGNESVRFAPGAGDGTFGDIVELAIPIHSETTSFDLADLDGNGTTDLFMQDQMGLRVMYRDGMTITSSPIWGLPDAAPTVVDLDGDGQVDVLSVSSSGELNIAYGVCAAP